MSVCLRLLALPAQVAPIYWLYEHRSTNIGAASTSSTNILVLLVLAAHICLPHVKVNSFWRIFSLLQIGLIRVERTINNYRTPFFLHGD